MNTRTEQTKFSETFTFENLTKQHVAKIIGASGTSIKEVASNVGNGIWIKHNNDNIGEFTFKAWSKPAITCAKYLIQRKVDQLHYFDSINDEEKAKQDEVKKTKDFSKTICNQNVNSKKLVAIIIGKNGENFKNIAFLIGNGIWITHNNDDIGNFTLEAYTKDALNAAEYLLKRLVKYTIDQNEQREDYRPPRRNYNNNRNINNDRQDRRRPNNNRN